MLGKNEKDVVQPTIQIETVTNWKKSKITRNRSLSNNIQSRQNQHLVNNNNSSLLSPNSSQSPSIPLITKNGSVFSFNGEIIDRPLRRSSSTRSTSSGRLHNNYQKQQYSNGIINKSNLTKPMTPVYINPKSDLIVTSSPSASASTPISTPASTTSISNRNLKENTHNTHNKNNLFNANISPIQKEIQVISPQINYSNSPPSKNEMKNRRRSRSFSGYTYISPPNHTNNINNLNINQQQPLRKENLQNNVQFKSNPTNDTARIVTRPLFHNNNLIQNNNNLEVTSAKPQLFTKSTPKRKNSLSANSVKSLRMNNKLNENLAATAATTTPTTSTTSSTTAATTTTTIPASSHLTATITPVVATPPHFVSDLQQHQQQQHNNNSNGNSKIQNHHHQLPPQPKASSSLAINTNHSSNAPSIKSAPARRNVPPIPLQSEQSPYTIDPLPPHPITNGKTNLKRTQSLKASLQRWGVDSNAKNNQMNSPAIESSVYPVPSPILSNENQFNSLPRKLDTAKPNWHEPAHNNKSIIPPINDDGVGNGLSRQSSIHKTKRMVQQKRSESHIDAKAVTPNLSERIIDNSRQMKQSVFGQTLNTKNSFTENSTLLRKHSYRFSIYSDLSDEDNSSVTSFTASTISEEPEEEEKEERERGENNVEERNKNSLPNNEIKDPQIKSEINSEFEDRHEKFENKYVKKEMENNSSSNSNDNNNKNDLSIKNENSEYSSGETRNISINENNVNDIDNAFSHINIENDESAISKFDITTTSDSNKSKNYQEISVIEPVGETTTLTINENDVSNVNESSNNYQNQNQSNSNSSSNYKYETKENYNENSNYNENGSHVQNQEDYYNSESESDYPTDDGVEEVVYPTIKSRHSVESIDEEFPDLDVRSNTEVGYEDLSTVVTPTITTIKYPPSFSSSKITETKNSEISSPRYAYSTKSKILTSSVRNVSRTSIYSDEIDSNVSSPICNPKNILMNEEFDEKYFSSAIPISDDKSRLSRSNSVSKQRKNILMRPREPFPRTASLRCLKNKNEKAAEEEEKKKKNVPKKSKVTESLDKLLIQLKKMKDEEDDENDDEYQNTDNNYSVINQSEMDDDNMTEKNNSMYYNDDNYSISDERTEITEKSFMTEKSHRSQKSQRSMKSQKSQKSQRGHSYIKQVQTPLLDNSRLIVSNLEMKTPEPVWCEYNDTESISGKIHSIVPKMKSYSSSHHRMADLNENSINSSIENSVSNIENSKILNSAIKNTTDNSIQNISVTTRSNKSIQQSDTRNKTPLGLLEKEDKRMKRSLSPSLLSSQAWQYFTKEDIRVIQPNQTPTTLNNSFSSPKLKSKPRGRAVSANRGKTQTIPISEAIIKSPDISVIPITEAISSNTNDMLNISNKRNDLSNLSMKIPAQLQKKNISQIINKTTPKSHPLYIISPTLPSIKYDDEKSKVLINNESNNNNNNNDNNNNDNNTNDNNNSHILNDSINNSIINNSSIINRKNSTNKLRRRVPPPKGEISVEIIKTASPSSASTPSSATTVKASTSTKMNLLKKEIDELNSNINTNINTESDINTNTNTNIDIDINNININNNNNNNNINNNNNNKDTKSEINININKNSELNIEKNINIQSSNVKTNTDTETNLNINTNSYSNSNSNINNKNYNNNINNNNNNINNTINNNTNNNNNNEIDNENSNILNSKIINENEKTLNNEYQDQTIENNPVRKDSQEQALEINQLRKEASKDRSLLPSIAFDDTTLAVEICKALETEFNGNLYDSFENKDNRIISGARKNNRRSMPRPRSIVNSKRRSLLKKNMDLTINEEDEESQPNSKSIVFVSQNGLHHYSLIKKQQQQQQQQHKNLEKINQSSSRKEMNEIKNIGMERSKSLRAPEKPFMRFDTKKSITIDRIPSSHDFDHHDHLLNNSTTEADSSYILTPVKKKKNSFLKKSLQFTKLFKHRSSPNERTPKISAPELISFSNNNGSIEKYSLNKSMMAGPINGNSSDNNGRTFVNLSHHISQLTSPKMSNAQSVTFSPYVNSERSDTPVSMNLSEYIDDNSVKSGKKKRLGKLFSIKSNKKK